MSIEDLQNEEGQLSAKIQRRFNNLKIPIGEEKDGWVEVQRVISREVYAAFDSAGHYHAVSMSSCHVCIGMSCLSKYFPNPVQLLVGGGHVAYSEVIINLGQRARWTAREV